MLICMRSARMSVLVSEQPALQRWAGQDLPFQAEVALRLSVKAPLKRGPEAE